jgi:hypothetical protein
MEIIQIVSRLPPAIDGVGDYAFLLAQQLRKAQGINTRFVVCDPNWQKGTTRPQDNIQQTASDVSSQQSVVSGRITMLDGFPVYQLKKRSAAELLRVLSLPGMPTTVLLQYVGYGYEKRGCPAWLVRGLHAWKDGGQKSESISDLRSPTSSLSAHSRLLTMFHEVSANGPMWSSAFWTAPLQRWLAKCLAMSSEHCFTNLTLHARALEKFTSRKMDDFSVLPVFSNVGEVEKIPDWEMRAPRMIVFGSASWRRQIYTDHKDELEAACRALGLMEIVDIGAAVAIPQLSVRVLKRGILNATETSREMMDARAGFFTCPVNCLGKSGIFAAYAAHGLLPVTFAANHTENCDGLHLEQHFVIANRLRGHLAGHWAILRNRVREWYQPHSIAAQSEHFSKALLPS